jgi:hypothetical protein
MFDVIEPVAFAGRKVFLDLFLTPKALAKSKRDLAKMHVTTPQQLSQAPPSGMVVEVVVSVRTLDDGRQFNRVVSFRVISEGTPGALEPDAEELDEDDGEADTRDGDCFDRRAGEPN